MSKLSTQLLPVRVFGKIAIKRAFRDKTALFFIFAFPLIFLFVFGGIFGKSSDVSFKVALINQSDNTYAKALTDQINSAKIYKVSSDVKTLDAAKEKMNRGQLDAVIILPSNFGQQAKQGAQTPSGQAQVYYTNNGQQAGQALTS
ncbi:MAG: ABC transporter permease, partial [Candidatus Saccharimonadales bacterium]